MIVNQFTVCYRGLEIYSIVSVEKDKDQAGTIGEVGRQKRRTGMGKGWSGW